VHWNPIHDLDHRDDLDLIFEPLPASTGGGLYLRYADGTGCIAIDPILTFADRIDAIGHELVHHERGGGAHGRGDRRFRLDRIREERRVWRIVASRRVPVDALADFADRMADLGEGVGPAEVMAEFDVTRRVAEAALDNLTRHERGTR
jgi:hypothetical protein